MVEVARPGTTVDGEVTAPVVAPAPLTDEGGWPPTVVGGVEVLADEQPARPIRNDRANRAGAANAALLAGPMVVVMSPSPHRCHQLPPTATNCHQPGAPTLYQLGQ